VLRARRERPSSECGQQFPPSDGDCHTPLPREVRKWNARALRVIVSLSMYRSSLISASSVFDLDQCFLPVMSAF
jgi:hypothetical protein